MPYTTSRSSIPIISTKFRGDTTIHPWKLSYPRHHEINVNLLHESNRILESRTISCSISTAATVYSTPPAVSYLRPNHSSADTTLHRTPTRTVLLKYEEFCCKTQQTPTLAEKGIYRVLQRAPQIGYSESTKTSTPMPPDHGGEPISTHNRIR